MLKVAITKGRIENKFCELLKNADYDIEPIVNKDRKLMIKIKDDLELVFAKPNDVLNFVWLHFHHIKLKNLIEEKLQQQNIQK